MPAIVDRETWELAQERRNENQRALQGVKHDYLLRRRMRCGHKEILMERKTRLEQEIEALEERKAEVEGELDASVMTDDALDNLLRTVEGVTAGFMEANDDFETRRRLVEALRLTARPLEDDGEKKLRVKCEFGPEDLLILSTCSRTNQPPKLPLG